MAQLVHELLPGTSSYENRLLTLFSMNMKPPYRRILHIVLGTVIIVAVTCLLLETYTFQGHDTLWRTAVVSKNSSDVFHTDMYNDADAFQEVLSNSTNAIQKTDSTVPEIEDLIYLPSSCEWSPDETHACLPLLFPHMQASLNASRSHYRKNFKHVPPLHKRRYINRRWLFLGDSTIYHLVFADDHLSKYLTKDAIDRYQQHRRTTCFSSKTLNCTSVQFARCDIMSHLSLEPVVTWEFPNETNGEGPTVFGLENAYCTDCAGCESNILTCSLSDAMEDVPYTSGDVNAAPTKDSSYTGPAYGGFAAIEFARDVELQSTLFKTTQENWLLHYINKTWNSPDAIEEFGRPVCVVSAGIHDCTVRNITTEIYLQNVQWYLGIVFQQCDYVIWVANNCPLQDEYKQTKALMHHWNLAVQEVLLSTPFFRQNSFFLDVFESSIKYPHEDNMHMKWSWYGLLASFFRTLMDTDNGWYED